MVHDSRIRQGPMILAFLHDPYVSSNRFDETATITHSWSEQPDWLMIQAFVKVHDSSIPLGFMILAFLEGF